MKKNTTKRTTKRVARKRGAPEPEEYRDENGNEVWDWIAVENNHKRAARQVLALLDSEIVPLWLKEAVEDAIKEAGRRKVGFESDFTPVRRALGATDTGHDYPFTGEWLGVDKDPKVAKILADLFTVTSLKTFTLHLSEREQLARHILAVYNHPLTPVDLYNHVANFVTDGTGLKDEVGKTLLDDWAFSPETIAIIVDLANKHDNDEIGKVEGGVLGQPGHSRKLTGGTNAN